MKQPKYQKEFEESLRKLITPKVEIGILVSQMTLEEDKLKRIDKALKILDLLKAIL